MSARPQPHWFGPESRPLCGFFHAAEGEASIGLVICNAFGDEAIRNHRFTRHLALEAARRGIPTLRFDYDGTGDSAGGARDPGRVAAFIDSIRRAADELHGLAGVTRITLAGVRLGALLAAEAAIGRDDIAALIAIAPALSGRMHARELKALHRAIGLRESPAGLKLPEGEDEAAGFVITEETRAALAKIDLVKNGGLPAPRVLILERDDMPSNDAWPKRLRELGAEVEVDKVGGYVEMMLDPHESTVPEASVARAVDFVAASAPPGEARRPAAIATRAAARFEIGEGVAVRESAELIDGELFAMLTVPDAAKPKSAIVLLNAGSIHHVGPNRLHPIFARRLAASGHAVLRLDIAGLGESPTRAGQKENVVYPERGHADVARAIAFAKERANQVHVAGVCSGAFHAFSAAVRGAPIASAVAINPLAFFWHEGSSVMLAPHKVAGEAKRYSQAILDPEKWKKLLRGGVDVRAFAKVARARATDLALRRMREVARAVGRPLPDDLGAALERADKNGVKLRFVFAADDPGLDVLRGTGAVLERLVRRGAATVEVIDGPNHTFTQVWSHDVLFDRLAAIFADTR